jgi:cob(I)alamin adenosyltransferase
MSDFFTGEGDDGYTGILGEGRVPKYHARPETYGTVDEASSALGLARAHARSDETRVVIKTVQRDLYGMMAELAADHENAAAFRTIGPERVAWLEGQTEGFGRRVVLPAEFVLAGDTPAGAALDLARTVVRRAERLAARLYHGGEIVNADILRYLNRLSSLCFVLSLWESSQAGVERPSLAKDSP